jgi:hypothetical protein
MNKHKYLYLVFASLLVLSTAVLSDKNLRWLAFNGFAATNLSESLLSNTNKELPHWAWDYVIKVDSAEGIIVFSEHHSLFSYVYSPKNIPVLAGRYLSHLVGPWYVAKIET